MTTDRSGLVGTIAALLALFWLSFASTQAVVMQAGASSGMDMSRMTGAGICHTGGPSHALAKAAVQPAKAHKACPYCDAAANPPVCSAGASVPSSSTVAWTRYTVQALLGARGPPAFTPNARGPPALILTL